MSCLFDKNLLQEYLENTIEPLESIILEEHLKTCSDCRRDLAELKLLFWELEEMPFVEMPSEALMVKDEVLKNLKSLETSPQDIKNFNIRDLAEIQNNIFQNATLFLKFVPGTKVVANTSKSSVKKASSLLTNLVKTSLRTRSKNALLRISL